VVFGEEVFQDGHSLHHPVRGADGPVAAYYLPQRQQILQSLYVRKKNDTLWACRSFFVKNLLFLEEGLIAVYR